MAAGKGGVQKEEIQQWGTITLMRTVKNTHNIKLRENVRLGEMGSKYRCVVKIVFQKNSCNLKLLVGGIIQQ